MLPKRHHLLEPAGEILARVLLVELGDAHAPVLHGALEQVMVELAVVLEVGFFLAPLHFVERGLRDVEVALLDDLRHLAIEEREQQRTDVRAVHIGVRHDDDAVVAQLGYVEVLFDPGPERRDHDFDLVVLEHLVETGLLDVQNLCL